MAILKSKYCHEIIRDSTSRNKDRRFLLVVHHLHGKTGWSTGYAMLMRPKKAKTAIHGC